MSDGFDLIDADEMVYRRALVTWYDPVTKVLSPEAFKPTRDDSDGLSLWRAKYVRMEDVARGRQPEYYVAALKASEIIALGMHLEQDDPRRSGTPGHCVIVELTYERRKEQRPLEWRVELSKKAMVMGPFRNGDRT